MASVVAAVARQPVVDQDGDVVGYELLFQQMFADDESTAGVHGIRPGDVMTAHTTFTALGLGVGAVSDGKLLFCDVGRGILTGEIPLSLPPATTVVEIPPGIAIDDEVLAGASRLQHAGYSIAAGPDQARLVGESGQPVDIVRLDVRRIPVIEIPVLMERHRRRGVQFLAAGVETSRDFAACRGLEFDFFQGYFPGPVTTVSGIAAASSRADALRLTAAVIDEEADYDVIEHILRAQPENSYLIVQLAAIGRFGETRRNVASLRQALVWIGLDRLRGWIPALSLRPTGPAVESNLTTVLARARMTELLARRLAIRNTDTAFTAGMFSAFDLLLGVPVSTLPDMLEIPARLQRAMFDPDDRVGALVTAVAGSYQDSAVLGVRLGLDPEAVTLAAAEAFLWAAEQIELIDPQ